MSLADTIPLVWPLTFLLIALFIIHQVRAEVNPVIVAVVNGLSKNASSNAPQYAIAIGFGLSASLSAFYDVFNELSSAAVTAMSWHAYFALWAKVLNPFIVAVLAYATQSNFKKPNGGTTPPFVQPPTSS